MGAAAERDGLTPIGSDLPSSPPEHGHYVALLYVTSLRLCVHVMHAYKRIQHPLISIMLYLVSGLIATSTGFEWMPMVIGHISLEARQLEMLMMMETPSQIPGNQTSLLGHNSASFIMLCHLLSRSIEYCLTIIII